MFSFRHFIEFILILHQPDFIVILFTIVLCILFLRLLKLIHWHRHTHWWHLLKSLLRHHLHRHLLHHRHIHLLWHTHWHHIWWHLSIHTLWIMHSIFHLLILISYISWLEKCYKITPFDELLQKHILNFFFLFSLKKCLLCIFMIRKYYKRCLKIWLTYSFIFYFSKWYWFNLTKLT